MNDQFRFLDKYRFSDPQDAKGLNSKHYLYSLKQSDIELAKKSIEVPRELQDFWEQIGYGFFHKSESKAFNRFMGPESFKTINLREDFYEFDPDLELYDDEEYEGKLIFFEVNEGIYLLIDKEENKGKNAIFYFEEKIADSLEEFLVRFDRERHYFEND